MGNWFKIARIEVVLAARDRESVLWSLLAPLILVAFFGSFGRSGTPVIRARLESGANPEYVREVFEGFLRKEGVEISDSREVPVVVLPDSLIHKIVSGKKAEVRLEAEEVTRSVRTIQAKVQKALLTLSFRVRKEWLDTPPPPSEIGALFEDIGPIHVDSKTLGRAPHVPTGPERTLPQMVVMFLLFQLFTFYASLWVEDVSTGKVKRITMSPTRPGDLFIGMISSRLVWGIIQVLVIGVLGTFVFRIRWELPFFHVATVLLLYMVTITACGMFFASFFTNAEKANVAGVILSLVLAAVGGCWWPLEIVPRPMQVAALFTPTGLTMNAFGDLIADGIYSEFPVFNALALVLMSAVIMPLAIHRLRKQIVR